MNQNNKKEEDYLKNYISNMENKETPEIHNPSAIELENQKNDRLTDLQYFSLDVSMLPLGMFYPKGTVLMVRAAQVREIQAYSMVDDTNFYDMIEKMNDMLSSCVRVKYPDNTMKPYTDVKDGDRIYLIFLIRELTFQKGNILTTNATCKCGQELTIELKRASFLFWETDEKISKYFDQVKKCFKFELTNGQTFELAPPTIGLQKNFTEYIIRQYNEKKVPNTSFLKIMPFLLWDKSNVTYENIKSKLDEYTSMDMQSFQFLNSVVEKMNFGIKELVKVCSCGEEVHTEMTFPKGPSAIFIVQDGLEEFIKK